MLIWIQTRACLDVTVTDSSIDTCVDSIYSIAAIIKTQGIDLYYRRAKAAGDGAVR